MAHVHVAVQCAQRDTATCWTRAYGFQAKASPDLLTSIIVTKNRQMRTITAFTLNSSGLVNPLVVSPTGFVLVNPLVSRVLTPGTGNYYVP